MQHIKKRLFNNQEIHPWITDNSVYLGGSKTWGYDIFLSFTTTDGFDEVTTQDVNVLDSQGSIPVGVIVNSANNYIFELEDFNWDEHYRAGMQIIERSIALRLVDIDKYKSVLEKELKKKDIKIINP